MKQASWTKIGTAQYRKHTLYNLEPPIPDKQKFLISGSSFSGPFALTENSHLIVKVSERGDEQTKVSIRSCSGAILSSFIWEGDDIVGMGWTGNERLVIVEKTAKVTICSVQGDLLTNFSLGPDFQDQTIMDVKFWETGFVALTSYGQLWTIMRYTNPKPVKLVDREMNEGTRMISWAIIAPEFTKTTNVQVLLGVKKGTILTADTFSVEDQLLGNGPFLKMVVSPDSKKLACFTSKGILWVVYTDFSKNYFQFNTEAQVPPDQMVWVGNESVSCYWNDIPDQLFIFGHNGYATLKYNQPPTLISEHDGLRILTTDKMEFLEKVPDTTISLFELGSMAPGALLFDAYELFVKKDPKSDEFIRQISSNLGPTKGTESKTQLKEAVASCIASASRETDINLQQKLLSAASFGKCFLDEDYDPTDFVEVCKSLRVLNAIRSPEIGIPLTYGQYILLTPTGVIDRLIGRHHHLVAFKICEYLKLKSDSVLLHWACKKVRKDLPLNELLESIVSKLSLSPGVSYAKVAAEAFRCEKIQLATRLLDHEPRPSEQVPLLIRMKQEELALSKALESGDTDLVHFVIQQIKRDHPPDFFNNLLKRNRVALNLYVSLVRKTESLNALKELFKDLGLVHDAAILSISEANQQKDVKLKVECLEKTCKLFNICKDSSSVAATQEQMNLLLQQKEFEANFSPEKFIGMPVSDTIFKLLFLGRFKEAQKVRDSFKVPPKRFHWLKIQAFGERSDWKGLETFSKEKSPIGYAPFVSVCLDFEAYQEALKYLPLIKDHTVANNLLVGAKAKSKDRKVLQFLDDQLMKLKQ